MKSEEPIQSKPIHTLPPLPRKSSRVFYPPKRYLGIISEDVEKKFLIENEVHTDDLKTYNEAKSDIDSEKWLEAVKLEIDLVYSNKVSTLVDPSKGIVPIGYK